MSANNWVTLVSALGGAAVVSAGWFVTGRLNRDKEVALKRLEYRLRALESVLPVFFTIDNSGSPFTQPGFLSQLEDARSKIQLYGTADEIAAMEDFISAIEQRDLNRANAALRTLKLVVRRQIRDELQIHDAALY